jgi:hypothetical protein
MDACPPRGIFWPAPAIPGRASRQENAAKKLQLPGLKTKKAPTSRRDYFKVFLNVSAVLHFM